MPVQIAVPQSGQLPQVKGPEMNDRDRINDLLAMEKYMCAGYSVGLNEMQNPKLHQAVQEILNSVHQLQFRMFETMFGKGWYKMKAADRQEISQAYTQFSNYKSQFPDFH